MGIRIALVIFAAASMGADWPQHLGPTRNGVSSETVALSPQKPPRVAWTKNVGQGFAAPVVAGDRVVLFHRLADEEVVECMDAATGKTRWTSKDPATYVDDFGFDEGPRSTPVIAHGRVFTFGAAGILSCWDLDTGKKIWSLDVNSTFKPPKGFFGPACSPLLIPIAPDARNLSQHRLILHVGAPGNRSVFAFNPETGEPAWSTLDDEAGYSSPTTIAIGQDLHILSLTRSHLHCIEPLLGRVKWSVPFRSRQNASVNAATPIVVGNQVFITASYDTGARLFKVDDTQARPMWSSDEALSSHYGTPVHHDGHLYGIHGRQEHGPVLRSIEVATGKVNWSVDGFGSAHLIAAKDHLLILTEKGELVLAPASPRKFESLARHQVLGFDVRAHPALANGMFYARDKNKLICLDLRPAP